MYGQLNELPESSMSLIRVSIGVLPTNLTKNSCSITEADTDLLVGGREMGVKSGERGRREGWKKKD